MVSTVTVILATVVRGKQGRKDDRQRAAESNVILQPRTFGFPASPLSVAAK
jgi:hypothetical protein